MHLLEQSFTTSSTDVQQRPPPCRLFDRVCTCETVVGYVLHFVRIIVFHHSAVPAMPDLEVEAWAGTFLADCFQAKFSTVPYQALAPDSSGPVQQAVRCGKPIGR